MLPIERFDADPSSGDDGRTTDSAQTPSAPATAIGHYHLLQKIGEGGMGEVWLAEQKEPVRRRVAVKLIKAGMNTREVMARFESERQALALMEHPAIAKVFDAGSTPEGAPYFVMEYVAGMPITEYCDTHRLAINERLELFTHVCEGVRHAHQKAVIHRDLKPSNILVVELDGKAAPKIIDFGVAKALSQKLTAQTMFTRVGSLIGTPEYMSPEQAFSSGEDVDTRSDIYSLGIIFYELLAGLPPIELRRLAFDEFLKKLREEDPPKPSTKIRTQDEAASTDLAHKRQTEPLALAKQVGGDLDAIALKALEKDRSRRYSSVSDFAADIGRYLRNEAVVAVPPSAAYRARKFARRYRWALSTASAFVVVLVAAAGISIRQSIRANREAAVAQAVSDFLRNDLLAQAGASTQAGPNRKPDPDLKVRAALDRAAERIPGKFDKQPEVEAAIRDTIGQTYWDLGLYPEARTQLERALELYRRLNGNNSPITSRAMTRLGSIASVQGKYPEAETLLKQALEIQRRRLGAEHPDTVSSMNNLAAVYYGEAKYPEAEALIGQVLGIRRRVLGPENPDTLISMNNLAGVYQAESRYAEAETLYRNVLEIRQRILGAEHPLTLSTMSNLAFDDEMEGKYEQAEALGSQAVELQRRVLGLSHPETLRSANHLAGAYLDEGKFAQAEDAEHQVVDGQRQALGAEHPETLASAANLAYIYGAEGKYAEAEALQGKILETMRRVLGPEHPYTLGTMSAMADVYAAEGKYAEAEALQSKALETMRRVLGPEHASTLSCLGDSAALYEREHKYALAQTQAAETLTGRRRALGPDHDDTIAAMADLSLVYVSERKFLDGEPLAREAFESQRKRKPDHWLRFRAESLLGASLAGQKKFSEAEPLLLEGYQGMSAQREQIAVPDRYHIARARDWLVELYTNWGKPEKAAEWKKKTKG